MAIQSALPTYQGDTSAAVTPSRTGNYLEAYVNPVTNKEFFFADEGSYFSLITPTSETGIIGFATPTTFAIGKLNPFIYLYNGTQKRLYPQFIALSETVASVGGTTGGMTFVAAVDLGNLATTTATALTVSASNPATQVTTTGLLAFCGANVVTETASVIQYGDIVVRRTTIDIIGDHTEIVFGAPSSNGGASSVAATLVDSSRIVQPIVVPPGYSFKFFQWRASESTGPTFGVRMGIVLR